ncbi:MAG: hypothetical protein RLZZ253_2223, partial [Verrucomicrobiota bacterium]
MWGRGDEPQRIMMNPNLPGEHLYTNHTHPYVRAPHIYLALPTRFVPGRGSGPEYDQKDANVTDILFIIPSHVIISII